MYKLLKIAPGDCPGRTTGPWAAGTQLQESWAAPPARLEMDGRTETSSCHWSRAESGNQRRRGADVAQLSHRWAGAVGWPGRDPAAPAVLGGRAQPCVLGSPFLQQYQMLSVQFEVFHLIHFRD